MTLSVLPRKTLKGASTASFGSSCAKCKIASWALQPMKSKVTQIRMTLKTFTAIWRRSTVSLVPAHIRLWVQMEPRKRKDQDPGEVGWVFRWCTKQAIFYQRQSHWTTARKSQWTSHSILLQPWGKFGYLSVNYRAAKHPDLTQFLQKSNRRVDQCWRVNFWPSFSWYGWKNNYHGTSRTPPSSIFTNGKGTDRHAMINMESLYFQFRARS